MIPARSVESVHTHHSGDLDIRSGLVYLDMMTNFEKIGDYCYNVAEMVSKHMRRRGE